MRRTPCAGGTHWGRGAHSQPLTESEAVQAAEAFVIQNGYTDLAPSDGPLAHESLEWSDDRSELLKARHDSLERTAYGLVYTRKGGLAGWTVVFRYKEPSSSTTGRAVTMNLDGSAIRMEHVDFLLNHVDKTLAGGMTGEHQEQGGMTKR